MWGCRVFQALFSAFAVSNIPWNNHLLLEALKLMKLERVFLCL